MKIYSNIQQRTDEWMAIKRFKTSGSGIKPILVAKTKGPWKTYGYDLIAQREDKNPAVYEEVFLNRATQWGRDMEPFAVKAFEKRTGRTVSEVGWVESTDRMLRGRSGCSPDGIISSTEWIEIKCLASKNHVQHIIENKLPTEYRPQVMNYFVINPELKVVYFVLYDPRMKTEKRRLHIIPVYREDHEVTISDLKDRMIEFHSMLDDMYRVYNRKERDSRNVVQMDLKGNVIGMFTSCTVAAKLIGVSKSSIYRACRSKGRSHGFRWSYVVLKTVNRDEYNEFKI